MEGEGGKPLKPMKTHNWGMYLARNPHVGDSHTDGNEMKKELPSRWGWKLLIGPMKDILH